MKGVLTQSDAGAMDSRKAVYLNSFAGAKLAIAVRELGRFQRQLKRVSNGNKALRTQITGKEAIAMSKKDREKKEQALLEEYRNMVKKLRALSKISVRQFLGSRADGDPRVEYLTEIEAFKNLANVYFEVIMGLTFTKLGVSKEEYLKINCEQLSNQLKTMEQDLCITGWDQQGNPLFDLVRYAERTSNWPK
jgi:hypothetical protein